MLRRFVAKRWPLHIPPGSALPGPLASQDPLLADFKIHWDKKAGYTLFKTFAPIWQAALAFSHREHGFQGAWLILWRTQFGCEGSPGYALGAQTEPILLPSSRGIDGSHMRRYRDPDKMREHHKQADPQVVIHMASPQAVW